MKNQQIVFVDSAVEDWQSLVVGVKAGTEVILVDRARDGIEQIAEALQSRKGIESVHIISHGESGSLQLGQTSLNSDNLDTYRDSLKRWFSSSVNSLQNRCEILLYGCNVAAGKKGEAFVQKLSKLTKANIAASCDITGSALQGGNWVLEYATVAIKTGLAIEPEVMANYAHTLATFTVTNTADAGPGSLRDAITQANALAGADIINFNIPGAGVQTIAPDFFANNYRGRNHRRYISARIRRHPADPTRWDQCRGYNQRHTHHRQWQHHSGTSNQSLWGFWNLHFR